MRRSPRHPTLCSQETIPHEAVNMGIADAVNAWGCLQGRKGGSHGLGCVRRVWNHIGHRLAPLRDGELSTASS
jgi:hypothetical protein